MSIVGNNKIVAPVSIADLQTMLSSGDNSVKNLCQNQNIRMWAKFRPVEYKTLGRTGNPYMKQIADSNRANVAYGISGVPVWNRMLGHMMNFWSGYDQATTNIPDTVDENGRTLIQQRPTEGYWHKVLPSTFGRLTDFASSENPTTKGYFHSATPPIGGVENINIQITPGGSLTIGFSKRDNEGGVSEGLTITYEDLVSCGMLAHFPNNANIYNYYFGVALAKLNSSGQPTGTFYMLTQTTTMGSFQQIGSSITAYVINESFEGSYAVWPFISNTPVLGTGHSAGESIKYEFSTTTNTPGTFVALLEKEDVNITIRWAQVMVTYVSAYHDATNYHIIHVDYKVKNSMEDYDVNGLHITIEFLDYNGTLIYNGTDSIQRINEGVEVSINYSHHFQNTGGDVTSKVVRVTVASMSGVVFYRSNISVMVADIQETPPTPTPTA